MEHDFISMSHDVIHCPQSISVSFSDAFKLAQHNFRNVSSDFTWICTNIYRDIMRSVINIKGKSFDCQIGDVDENLFLLASLDFIQNIIGVEYQTFLDEIRFGTYYINRHPSIEVGIINDVFSNVGANYEINIIPKNHRKAIDKNLVNDVNLECSIDGPMLMGKITLQIKTIVPLDRLSGD